MYRVLQQFYDAQSLKLIAVGTVVDWTDADRIKSALDRGLIEEVKTEKPKAPAKKKTASKKGK